MKPSLVFFLIHAGVMQQVLSVSRKYYLIQQNKTWSDAQTYCRSAHTDLASIGSEEHRVQIYNETQMWGFTSSAWMGLYKNLSQHWWRWSMGDTPVGAATKWGSSAADNCCGAVISGVWSQIPCSLSRPFMCYDDTKNDTDRYVYYTSMKTWVDAQSFCRQYHTDLSSSRDDAEFSTIQQKITNPYYFCWIGLYRDVWVWSDRGNLTFAWWITGQPNGTVDSENCAYLSNAKGGDEQCSKAMPFLCYSEVMWRRLVRLTVRSSRAAGELAQDTGILEKIYQKLQEHGVNVTVTWRKQTDGSVFRELD